MKSSGIVLLVIGAVLLFVGFLPLGGGLSSPDGTYTYFRSGIEVRFENEGDVPSGAFADVVERIVRSEGLASDNPGGHVGSCVVRVPPDSLRIAFACQSFGREQGLREFSIGGGGVSLDELHTALSTFFSAVDAEMTDFHSRQQWHRLPTRDKTAFFQSI